MLGFTIRHLRGGAALAVLLCTGCVSPWWNSFLDPSEVGNYRQTNLVNEIQETISFLDKSSGIPNAVDPTPADLEPVAEAYQMGPGDVLQIRMLDFLARDSESEFTVTVDELGRIDVPQLGLITVSGMSAPDLRQELIQRSKEANIYRQDSEPTVTVMFLAQQHRMFNVSGAITQPGAYRITRTDFRLMEAINLAGGLSEQVKDIYVWRGGGREDPAIDETAPMWPPPAPEGYEEPVPPVLPGAVTATTGSPASDESEVDDPSPATRPNTRPGGLELPPDEVERDLIDALSPTNEAPEETTTVPAPTEAASEPVLPPFIFVNDQFIEPPPTTQRVTEPEAPPTREQEPDRPTAPVDWEELAAEDQQRIIHIPADRLRSFDSSYDIIIRHRDWIRIDPGPTGFFYMDGHVLRPGTYTLSGQPLTLVQAIAAAGGLDPLAWPTRCEVRRRIDQDREEITQWDLARIMDGRDPNFFIKQNDVIRVGTHAIAPFLATIRNSFRLAWGFGFVYDRNFADIDSFGPKLNPETVRRAQRQQRFPGLF